MGEVLPGVGCDIFTTSTPSIPLVTPESCTDSGDHTFYTASGHEFWDWTKPFTVQCGPNGTSGWAIVTDYEMRWAVGQIKFNSARTVGVNNFVRISAGSYLPATQLDMSYGWMLTTKGNEKDSTAFQAPGAWAQNTATTKSATGKIDTYRNDDRLTKELNNLLGMKLYIDRANNIRFQFFARQTGGPIKSPATALQEEEFNFTVVRDVYLMLS
jgi:hypothetical protein